MRAGKGINEPAVFLAAIVMFVLAFVALVFVAVGLGVAVVERFVAGVVGSITPGGDR